jgi:Cytochrome c554 and c-prime
MRTAAIIIPFLLAATVAGCKRCADVSESTDPVALFERSCSGCHKRAELAGSDAAKIRAALDRVGSMSALRDQLKPAQIAALGAWLSGKPPAKGAGSAKTAGAVGADQPPYRYQLTNTCVPCHKRQVQQWRTSMHARAHFETIYDAYFVKASLETNQKIETFCARCHTPLGVHQKEIPFKHAPRRLGETDVSPVAAEGVQCDFCHTLDEHDRLENGGYRMTPTRVMLGPLKGSRSPMHGTAFAARFRQAELCGPCHQVSHPQNGIVLESTYQEWKRSAWAREGVVCQDCHMTAGLTRRVVRQGKAGHGGPTRPHISDHHFVGPNIVFYGDGEADREARARSLELLRRAAKLTIEAPLRKADTLTLPIRVSNVGAGHGLPTGVTELREMWLEVRVTDAAGATLHHSGALNAQGDHKPGAALFRTEVFDADGALTTRFWRTARKGRDHRVPARGSVVERVVLPLKAGAYKPPLQVRVKLRYRSVPPWGLQEVGLRGKVKVPVVTMAEASRSI